MTDLPPGWEWATLEDLAAPGARAITDGPFGSNLKSSHYVESGPRVIRLQNIGFGDFIDEHAHISEEHFEHLRAHEAQAGDLIVASLGQDLPRACLVPSFVGPAIVKADCIRVRLHPDLHGRYVNYALQRAALRHAVAGQIHGVGRPRLGMAGIKQLSVPVAPRHEQERIVAAIEDHLSRLDAAEAMLALGLNRVASLEQSVLVSALDPQWLTRPLVEACSVIVDCPHSTAKFVDSGPMCVDTTNIKPFGLIEDRLRYVSKKTYLERIKRLEPVEGDVIFAREGTVGTAVRVPPGVRLCLGQRVMLLRAGAGLRTEFLELVMNSHLVRRQYRPLILGTTAPHLNVRDVKLLQIPVPALAEQEHAVRLAHEGLRSTDRVRTDLARVQRRSVGLRRSILAGAFSGQLVPQDSGDEPASALLERIRAKHAAAVPPERIRWVKTS